MILCKPDILAAIEAGELVIDPFEPELIGAASIDLRLSPHFRRLHRSDEALDVLAERDYREPAVSEYVEVPEDGSIVLDAGETILGLTVERVRFGPTMCGRLEGRSRFARLGLLIHISAGFMAPGTDNQQVLEISNMAMRPLRLPLLRP